MEILKDINNNSLTKIIFYFNGMNQEELVEEMSYFNIIYTKDGIFHATKNELYIHFNKLNDITYSNSILNEIEDGLLIQLIPKPKDNILNQIIDIFLYVKNKTKYELAINLYYDLKNKKFIIDIIDQIISSTLIEYKYNDKYENNSQFIRYLQIHSHHTMKAFFSPIDDDDEQNKCNSYFGVIGELKNKSQFSQKYRIYNNEFISVDQNHVFDIKTNNIKLNKNIIVQLDKIINHSVEHNNKDDVNSFLKNIDVGKKYYGV